MPSEKMFNVEEEILKTLKNHVLRNSLSFTELYEALQKQEGHEEYCRQVRSYSTLSKGLKSLALKGHVQRDIRTRKWFSTPKGEERRLSIILGSQMQASNFMINDHATLDENGQITSNMPKIERKSMATYLFIEQKKMTKEDKEFSDDDIKELVVNSNKLGWAILQKYGHGNFELWDPAIEGIAKEEGVDYKTHKQSFLARLFKDMKNVILIQILDPEWLLDQLEKENEDSNISKS